MAALSSACDDGSANAAQYGDPVGIVLEAHGAIPALGVAVAVTKGRDVTAVVSSVAGAIAAAANACPPLVAAVSGGSVARLAFTAQGGVIHGPAKPPQDPVAACAMHALEGKTVAADKPDALDILVEIRDSKGDGGHR
jgi:hypothetical protein